MRLSDLHSLIASGETDTVEFKRSTAQLSAACMTLCSFLNGHGGTVVIGVSPDGHVTGQEVSDNTLQKIAGEWRKFEPAAAIEMIRIDLEGSGREVIVLEAPWRPDSQPYLYDGRAYQRVGSTTQRMPQHRYQTLLLQRAHSTDRWENAIAPRASISDLDRAEIDRTVRVGFESGRIPVIEVVDHTSTLERLGLLRDGHLVNAAVVLFGKVDPSVYPQLHLRLARFRGFDKREFVDSQQVHGNVFELLQAAMAFAQRHLPIAGRVQPGIFERVDDPIVPAEALRETLVNAICHRDYSIAGGSVSLAVFSDRLEVWSDGTLPHQLTVDDLKRDHPSRPRNPLLADVLYKRGLVERWGRGTQRIVELCRDAGQPDPEFLEHFGSVGVRFDISVTPEAANLSDRQKEILRIVQHGDAVALREIMGRLANPPSRRTVQSDLERLRNAGLVIVTGYGRGAVYRARPVERE